MKKVLTICLLAIILLSLTACGGKTSTPAAAWAGVEVLNYKISKIGGGEIGTMTTTLRRKNADSFVGEINGVQYTEADCSMEIIVETDDYNINTFILSKGYNTIAVKKNFVDKQNAANNYNMSGYHSGKYFKYIFNGENHKLNIGAIGYTESEFIYTYIRCYGIGSVPSTIKIADVKNDTVTKVSASSFTAAKVFDAVPYPDGTKAVNCNMVSISLNGSPSGKGITAYYTPDSAEYNVDSFAQSATSSRKFPVMIVENDITYTLSSMFIA